MTTDNNQDHRTQPSEAPFLTLHTAVVLLTAAAIGGCIGVLTLFTHVPLAAAVIAGLTATGASIPVLRSLIR
ncbi:hypothetical protein [Streptomyces sp. NPDC049915]|uniref:hypothetical protein n=1 Tax=Streptomyces sp. NPDC049915 TaxID=3155510 RepID=UPI0034362738